MNLLRMSSAGAVMILVVTVIRALFIYRVPKKTFLVLWGITLARLLIPFSAPSAFSVSMFFGEKERFISNIGDTAVTTFVPAIQESQMTAVPNHIPYSDAAVSIWAIGALICAVVFSISYRKCYREFQTSLPFNNDFTRNWLSSHQIKRCIDIRQIELVSAPLTFGILRPVILMPKTTDWQNEQPLQYVLEHEFVHIRRFDSITKLILIAALCVHWFNPFVWVLYILANRDIELSCDETVLRQFGEHTKSCYARTLISMEETKSGITPLCNNFSKNALEERMTAIMKTKKTTVLSLTLATSLVFGTVAFAASVSAVPPKSDDSAESMYATSLYLQSTGETFYIDSNGRKLSEAEYKKRYPSDEIEWWTYEEYKDWLENEKKQLPNCIGHKGWANGKEFVWTQEMVDKAIAMYEENLQQIKDGMLLSKTVNGKDDICIFLSFPNKT